jgi:hypothetical protein
MKVKRQKERLALLGVQIHFTEKNLHQDAGFHWSHQVSEHKSRTGSNFPCEKACIRDAWGMLMNGVLRALMGWGDPRAVLDWEDPTLKRHIQISQLNLLGVTVKAHTDEGKKTYWYALNEEGDVDIVICQRKRLGSLIKHTWRNLIAAAE